MDWNQIEGSWKQIKGRARQRWGDLTDDDLDRISGSREELIGTLQRRYGAEKTELERQVDEWSRKLD